MIARGHETRKTVIMMKSILRSVLCVLLAVSLSAVCAPVINAEEEYPDASPDPKLKLRVALFDSAESYTFAHEFLSNADTQYVLFLPAGCDRTKLRVSFDAEQITVDGKALRSGDPTDAFQKDGTFTVATPDGTYPLRVISSSELPSVYITTQSGSLDAIHADKSYCDPGFLSVAENGELTLNHAQLAHMKGRGNSSWLSGEKRSYTIKFQNETAFLGMPKAKKWALISNTMDETLLHNAAAYSAAKQTSIPYTVDYAFVDLYINGNYRGNYMVCEKIEIGTNRVDIEDLEKNNESANPDLDLANTPKMTQHTAYPMLTWSDIPNDPSDISGGYLLEYDYPEELDIQSAAFLTEYGSCLVLHDPEFATQREIEYISTLYNSFEEALIADDGRNSEGKHFTDYIDVDSFADGVLLYEFTIDPDRGYSSWYIFLQKDSGKFVMGPVWDFDLAFEYPEAELSCMLSAAKREYDGLRAAKRSNNITFIELLCSHRDFIDTLSQRFDALESDLHTLTQQMHDTHTRCLASIRMNAVRWGRSEPEETCALESYIPARIDFMRSSFDDIDAHIAHALESLRKNKGYSTEKRLYPPQNHNTNLGVICCSVAAAVAACTAATVLVIRKRRKKQNTL